MNETEQIKKDVLKQRLNILFRDMIIKRERQKALRAYLRVSQQKDMGLRRKEIVNDASLDKKAALLAHIKQHIAQSLTAWNRSKNENIIFIRRENRNGTYFQTFNRDAIRAAKILGLDTKQMLVNRKMVHYISVPEKKMPQVISEIERRDLKASCINKQGQQVPLKRKCTPTVSVAVKPPTPKLDVMESLERNRRDGRQSSIKVESLEVWADSKGNWKVSGLVNGQTVSAKSIEQADAFSYKKGEITGEQLAAKYNLHEQKKQTPVVKKNSFARRYSLDSS